MSVPAEQLQMPSYISIRPVEYKGVVFGVEVATEIWDELLNLATVEWEEVGDDERLGEFRLSRDLYAALERGAGIITLTVRELGSWELRGYWVGTFGRAIKQGGCLILSEIGLYLAPEVRRGRTANRLLEYVERAATKLGCQGLIISHRPGHERIGKLYRRAGYEPLSSDYYKRLTDD